MTQEEKQLLLQELCGRLPYGVKVKANLFNDNEVETIGTLKTINLKKDWFEFENIIAPYHLEELKPYLRPMSSMTKEERNEYHSHCNYYYGTYFDTVGSIDWLNANHFDYHRLIEKGIAIEVTKDNNPYEN